MDKELLSIITPAYNEEINLPLFYEHVKTAVPQHLDWEWIIVDDHSNDNTFATASMLAASDCRVKAVRLSRNSGSHKAIYCGLQYSSGSAAVVMAADLQDPPEEIPRLLERRNDGFQIVWCARRKRHGEKSANLMFSRFYYFLMRRMFNLKEMPATGADFFLIDRTVIAALLRFPELNTSILGLLTWMGFRQCAIEYDKQSRLHGKSGWSLRKKLTLIIDSVTCFSFLPIRILSGLGIIFAILGLAYSVLVFINGLRGIPSQGWASLMIVLLITSGFQMLMLGVLGEYLWRNLEESRRRPRFLIEASINLNLEDRNEK